MKPVCDCDDGYAGEDCGNNCPEPLRGVGGCAKCVDAGAGAVVDDELGVPADRRRLVEAGVQRPSSCRGHKAESCMLQGGRLASSKAREVRPHPLA